MAALAPDAGRVSRHERPNTAGVISGQRLAGRQRAKPSQRQISGRPFGDADPAPQAEIEHRGPDDRSARNILLVPSQEHAARRHPCAVLREDQLIGLEGIPNALRVRRGATVEHLVETAIPFLDLMGRSTVRFRKGTEPVQQASRPARCAANAEQVEQRARRFPVEQAMHERLDIHQRFRLRRPA